MEDTELIVNALEETKLLEEYKKKLFALNEEYGVKYHIPKCGFIDPTPLIEVSLGSTTMRFNEIGVDDGD